MWIHLEERPTGEAGLDGAFQPCHRLVRIPDYCVNARDLIVAVVRVAEGTRAIQRVTNTLQCQVGLIAPGVQHALKADDKGLVRMLFQSRRQPLFGELQVPAEQRRDGGSGAKGIVSSRRLEEKGAIPGWDSSVSSAAP